MPHKSPIPEESPMRYTRATTVLALGLTLALLPAAADACDDPGDHDRGPDFTAVYVYQKDNPEAGASWENSGAQTLIVVNDGHRWVRSISVSSLPDKVCGPGWGVQQDFVTGIARETIPDRVNRATNVGVLKWPPIVDAKHGNLSSYVTVPDCIEGTPVTRTTPITPITPITPTTPTTPATPARAVQADPRFTG